MDGAAGSRSRRLYTLAFVALTAVGIARIASTVTTSFQTHDEPFHAGCGALWFAGEYPYACQDQPPLSRIAAALPLQAVGVTAPHFSRRAYVEGSALLRSGDYRRNLALARLGLIPFFVLASYVVWVWARRLYGDRAALAAVFLFQGLPSILTFSGIVMTDIAITATLAAALYLFVRWLESPSWRIASLWGAAIGSSVLSKHSGIPFLVVGAVPIAVAWAAGQRGSPATPRASWRLRLGQTAVAAGVAAVIIWAGYGFRSIPLTQPEDRPHRIGRLLGVERWPAGLREAFLRTVELPVPAGDLFHGIAIVKDHDAEGHEVFFRGAIRTHGTWTFFPTMLAVKTPIPFLLLTAVGCGLLLRREDVPRWSRLAPVLAAAGVFLFAMTSHINLGLRHVLPIFPLLAIEAGRGLEALATARRWRPAGLVLAGVLAIWFAAAGWRAHPDYLTYFNELVEDPAEIVVDSDFEFGQDIKALLEEASRRGASRLNYWCRDCGFLRIAGLPQLPGSPAELRELVPYEPVTGWVGVGESTFRLDNEALRLPGRTEGPFGWLEGRPFTRVGRTMRLYWIDPN